MGKRAKVSYDLLIEKLNNIVIPELNVIDVSHMFNINTEANVSALMFKRENGNHLIWLHGFDDSGSDNDLEVIPVLGFGPQYSSYQAARQTIDGITFEDLAIVINKELDLDPGKITIPMGLKSFDVHYYLHDGSNTIPSYYIADGVMYPFELENTPISNLCTSANSMLINEETVLKKDIQEILIGSSYQEITTIPYSDFIVNLPNLYKIELKGLKNVTYLASGLNGLPLLSEIDLTPLSNLTIITPYLLDGCTSIKKLDISIFINATTIGEGAFYGMAVLEELIIGELSKVESIQNYAFRNLFNLKALDFRGFPNLKNIGYRVGSGSFTHIYLDGLSKLEAIESEFGGYGTTCVYLGLSGLTSLKRLEYMVLYLYTSLPELNLSDLTSLEYLGSEFIVDCSSLKKIQIGAIDWMNIEVGPNQFVGNPNDETCELYADSNDLAETFKSKMGGALDNWTVVLNS